jgi:hypothetical protein
MTSLDDDNFSRLVKLEDGLLLKPMMGISTIWKEQPPADILSVVLPRPTGSESEWPLSSITDLTGLSCP